MNVKEMTYDELWAWMVTINCKDTKEKVYAEIKLRDAENQK